MLIGCITPDESGGKPRFTILDRHGRTQPEAQPADAMAGVRPCPHEHFILDEKWCTVTCADCKERVEAFAVLLNHAVYWNDLRRQASRQRWAYADLLRGSIRLAMRRRGPDEGLKTEATRLISGPRSADVEAWITALETCEKSLEEAHRAWQASRHTVAAESS